ncbi:hypothetical protein ACHWQZ_G016476 [Mnemiopsis leidyi]
MFAANISSIDNSDLLAELLHLTELEQTLLFLFNLLLCFASIVCNSVVLYGALKHRALKSDATTILLLETLTVLDMMITLANLVPVTITTRTGTWVLGPALCVITSVVTRYLYFAELLVVSLISLHRLRVVLLRKAGRPSTLQRKRQVLCTKIVLGVVALLPIFPLSASLFGPSQAEFVTVYLSCAIPSTPKAWEYVALSYLIFPSAIVIVCNIIITYNICTANCKSRGGFFSSLKSAINPGTKLKSGTFKRRKLNHSTYLTIILICMVFMLTYSPVYVLVATSDHENDHKPTKPWLGVLSTQLLSLNVLANPIVYTLSNGRFRRYVINLMQCRGQDVASQKLGLDESSSEGFISTFFSTARTSVASVRASVVSVSRNSTVRLSKLSLSSKSSLKSRSVEMYSSADQLKVGFGSSNGGVWDSKQRWSTYRANTRPLYRRAKSCNAVPVISEADQESSHSSSRSMVKPRSCSSILNVAKSKDLGPLPVITTGMEFEESETFSCGSGTSEIGQCGGVTFCAGDSIITADLSKQISEIGVCRTLPCKSILKTPTEDLSSSGIGLKNERRVGVVAVKKVCIHNRGQ